MTHYLAYRFAQSLVLAFLCLGETCTSLFLRHSSFAMPSIRRRIRSKQPDPAGSGLRSVQRRISSKRPVNPLPATSAASGLPVQGGDDTESVCSCVTDAQLKSAIKEVVVGKDLDKISLRQLRKGVVRLLDLPKSAKRQLENSRREAFTDLVQITLREVRGDNARPKPDWQTMEDEDVLTSVYLVTLAEILSETAQAASTPLRPIAGLSREGVRDVVLDAVKNPVQTHVGGRPASDPVTVLKLVVAKEEPLHFHIALQLSKRVVFMPFKLALRLRSGLASHWSISHREFWSTIRYLHFTTERKQKVDREKISWTPDGRDLDFYYESQEPFIAHAYKARREMREAQAHAQEAHGQMHKKGHKASASSRFTKLDFIALAIAKSFETPAGVLEYAQAHGSEILRNFVAKHQRCLAEYLEDAKQWSAAADVAAKERQSDWDLIQQLARRSCSCGNGVCQWWEAADDFFARNSATITREELASSMARVVLHGPGKEARVPLIVGSTNAGKSTVLKPLIKVFGFGNVVHRPAEKATMALANVTKRCKRFIFWDEYRPVEFAVRGTVPVGTFLSLFGGTPLEIQLSQSFNDGNGETLWKRGAAMTAKADGLWDPMAALAGMTAVTAEDIRHMQSRVHQFHALAPVPSNVLASVPDCPETWCRWIVADAARAAVGQVQRPLALKRLSGRAPPPLPDQNTVQVFQQD